ncbi:hypothetical protein SO694_0024105 [Aureococcus anophagefferens]|uniref:Uncharacterized protein n=1 Tax=Aureococcus anophagefferens TaxID=44056 RepID=A0ABR1FRG3_AURAN
MADADAPEEEPPKVDETLPLLEDIPTAVQVKQGEVLDGGGWRPVRRELVGFYMQRVSAPRRERERERAIGHLGGAQVLCGGHRLRGLPSTIYGFFLGYLNVEGYVYATAATIVSLPWSFKFLFGAINDCVPLFGYRRKPYMVLGWLLCSAALLRLAAMPLPRPYWCPNAAGDGYVRTVHTSSGAESAEPCNPKRRRWAANAPRRFVGDEVELKKDEEDDLPALPDGAAYEAKRTFRQYAANVFELLRGRAMLFVILYQFLTPIVRGVSTTAGGEVKQYWAHVKTFQNACFSLVGLGLFAAGLYLVKTRLLDQSWRHMLLVTTVFLNVVDMPFTFCTIFDVVRDQYFYLGETVLVEIPAAANFVVSTFVIAISNQIFGLWSPSLSDSSNYIEDAPVVPPSVALSFAVSYFFAFASLATLPLLPNQKDEAQERKRKWEKRDARAYVHGPRRLAGLVYSVTVNFLAMFPSTMCLKIAGGGLRQRRRRRRRRPVMLSRF